MNPRALDRDTIVAISTPPGEGGIGVVRLSGPDSIAVADKLFRSKNGKTAASQRSYTARYGFVVNRAETAEQIIDEALLLVMRAPRTFTGEDVAELSLHGGNAVLSATVDLAVRHGARLAEPGEFTKRAFLNGRLDLVQAEAVLDLIRAKTDLSRRWAVGQLSGDLSQKMRIFKNELLDVLTHLEASIDFPDDFPDTASSERLRARLRNVAENMRTLLASARLGFLVKRGLRAVICGRPNVGKSSLLNALTGSERVIVTPHAGTTRDVVEEEVSIDGYPVRLMDTAGIRESDHPIEREGVIRTRKALESADLTLLVVDASQPLAEEDKKLLAETQKAKTILIMNKMDIVQHIENKEIMTSQFFAVSKVSCLTNQGMTELSKTIRSFISHGQSDVPDDVVINTVRQRDALEKALAGVERAELALAQTASAELVAVDVREALDYLGQIVGEIISEDVLEALFSQFCIGK